MSVMVHQYGAQRRWDVPAEMLDQIRRAHDLRNAFVEIDHAHDARLAEIVAADDSVAALDMQIGGLEEKLDTVRAQVARSRVASRSKQSDAGLRAEETALRGELRTLRDQRKQARALGYAAAKPAIEAARADRKAAVKTLYAVHVQDGGLHWATHNEVVEKHATAAKRIIAMRKQGRPAKFRFHRWTGEGTIAVQLQRGADQPRRRDAATLAAPDSPWRNVLRVPSMPTPETWVSMTRAEQRAASRVTIGWSIGAGRVIEIPVVMHRPLPADAEVVAATLTRRMVAGHANVTVQLSLRTGDPEPVSAGPLVAMHAGWRTVDGGVRVASIVSSVPLPEPGIGAAGVVRRSAVGWDVVLPDEWRRPLLQLRGVESTRSTNLDAVRSAVAEWMRTNGHTAESLDLRSHPSLWKAAGRFAWLARHFAATMPDDPIVEVLEAWRRQDRHLWEWHANESDQIAERRGDAYRNVAAWVASSAGAIVLDEWAVAELRMVSAIADDTHVEEQSRRNGQWAAVAELTGAVRNAAGRRGVAVDKVESRSGVHWGCGGVLPGEDRARRVVVACEGCGAAVDQDHNAVRRMLGERSSASPVAG